MSDMEWRFKDLVAKVTASERLVVTRPELTRAAVLVPIVFRSGEPCLIMTKRTMTVAMHRGQNSFPGGVHESGDRDIVETALQEALEEIGLDSAKVEVVGLLDDVATNTRFAVTPVVGFVASDASLCANPLEVAELFEVSLATLRDPAYHDVVTEKQFGFHYSYHRYDVDGRVIWGSTAWIINQFITALKEAE
jgi:8-oxo-dGTP pyrophosphatase MutT (NUDIX family)